MSNGNLRSPFLQARLEGQDFPTDRVHVRRLAGREAISRLYAFDLEIVVLDPEGLDLDAMAGADAAIVFTDQDGVEVRRVHGMISEIDDVLDKADAEADLIAYRVRLVPRVHRLTLVQIQEIFLDLSVPEILTSKLEAVQLSDAVEQRLVGRYPAREFVVQYAETDLALVSRLTEHLGISFFFEQRAEGDTIVFTDHAEGFPELAEAPRIKFSPRGEHARVHRLGRQRRLVSGLFVTRDYNYRTPQVDLTGREELDEAYAGGVVEEGAHMKTPEEGATLARVRAEEARCRELGYSGKSAVPQLRAGARFTVEEHPSLGEVELLLVEVEHRMTLPVAGTVAENEPPFYENTFRAVPAGQPYRPARVTPRPRIAGLITGRIDPGPQGEPTYAQIDEQGRYMVRFLFDPDPHPGQAPSRPVRMVQPHAGERYGMHFPLKPGTEVVLGFIDGDPDRPLIVGAVPNPITPSPVDRSTSLVHRIRTQTGIVLDLVDGS